MTCVTYLTIAPTVCASVTWLPSHVAITMLFPFPFPRTRPNKISGGPRILRNQQTRMKSKLRSALLRFLLTHRFPWNCPINGVGPSFGSGPGLAGILVFWCPVCMTQWLRRRRLGDASPAQWTVKCVPLSVCHLPSVVLAKAIGVLALVSKGKCAQIALKCQHRSIKIMATLGAQPSAVLGCHKQHACCGRTPESKDPGTKACPS